MNVKLFAIFAFCSVAIFSDTSLCSEPPQTKTKEKSTGMLPGNMSPEHSDAWISADKFSHFTVSAYLVAGQKYVAQEHFRINSRKSMKIAIISTAAVGLGKEIYDKVVRKKKMSAKDLAADLAGIGVAFLMCRR